MEKIKNSKGFLFDLDGVFIQSGKLLPGALETYNVLKSSKIPFRFLTNTTTKSRNTLHKFLFDIGLKCNQREIISAGYSGVEVLKEMGSPTCYFYISDDLKKDYHRFIESKTPDVIVIGDYQQWNYELLNQAFLQVMHGAKIIALNSDRFYMINSDMKLDTGAFVKALEFATGVKAHLVGKPNSTFFQTALNDLKLAPKDVLMVGDDLISDIDGAQKSQISGIIVKTGKFNSTMLESSSIEPDGIIDSIGDIAKIIST